MKRCPKCSRTYPDDNQKFCTVDGGLLLSAEQGFDPNATIQIPMPPPASPPPQQPRDMPRQSANLGETIALTPPTADLPRTTGPLSPLSVPEPHPSSVTTALPRLPEASPVAGQAAQPQKKSKLPMILGILLLLLVLGVGAVVALFFLVIKPRLNQIESPPVVSRTNQNENVNQNVNNNTVEQPAPPTTTTEPEVVPPPNSVKFTNSKEDLDGKLAEHYLDFSFYYPNNWEVDPKATSNFVKVEKTKEDDKGVYLLESAGVNWYNSNGTFEADKEVFQERVKSIEAQIASSYPGYEKVSEGETKVNSLRAYEFRFKGNFKDTGPADLPYWGRVILVPAGDGARNGAVISLLATSLSPDVSGVADVGEKGETSVILESFRFGRNQ